ncbi:DUF3788 domain-containing protein [Enterococcus sp. HY326]|uniref:DUF3788 domain-containing protein n=1 Tax=Enterococcus sp. HY326 TaxID=2971265 RepID=UPI0022407DE9|nr:DUF3788 domain-containing protein [Enterococcus sp. HY326]
MANWLEEYPKKQPPTFQEISKFINNPLWLKFNDYLSASYQVKPKFEYSACSMQAGWNVKYKKSGKSLCTLYPMSGYFIALVVIGQKEMTAAETLLPLLSEETQKVFAAAKLGNGQKWLMLNIDKQTSFSDALQLIRLRVQPKVTVKV